MTVSEKIKSLWSVSAPVRVWPCLVGHTGSGKTSIVRSLAAECGIPCHTLLLGTSLPEDILGLPKISRGVTEWSLPSWARELTTHPGILFLDELDKARPECVATVLTLMTSLEVRGVSLHPQTKIVCAMQPVSPREILADETGRALVARVCFVPVPYDTNYLQSKYQVNLDWLALPRIAELPLLSSPSTRQIEFAICLVKNLLASLGRDNVLDLLRGMLSNTIAEQLVSAVEDSASVSVDYVGAILRDPSLLRKLSLAEYCELAPELVRRGGGVVVGAMISDICTRFADEDSERVVRAIAEQLSAQKVNAVAVDDSGSIEEYTQALLEATLQVFGPEKD
jgi:hypothetical protein